MTETQALYTVTDTDGEDEHRHYHDCGHLIGVEIDGVIIRKGDIYYSLLMVCPQCRTLITWKKDRLKEILTKYRKEYHGMLEELDIEKIIVTNTE